MAEETKKTSMYKSVQSFNSTLTPDCAKFCPLTGYQQILAVAFYELKDQQVLGELQLSLLQRVESAGILDMQWFPDLVNGQAYLCTACSDSFVRVYQLKHDSNCLELVTAIQTEERSKCLYIDVAVISSSQIKLVTSTDSECVYLMTLIASETTLSHESTEKIQNHKFSVWACAISKSNPEMFLSGADDQKLALYDARVEGFVVAENKRTHQMGITTINFDPLSSNSFFTGSYDEHLRLWDIRNIAKPIFESKREGGVWRAVWKPQSSKQSLLGVYCQKYFEIIDLEDIHNISQVEKLEGHDSLAYSCDWSQDCKNIVTCSFYDRFIQFWELKE